MVGVATRPGGDQPRGGAGAALIAGWTSNLLDRLGMHAVTAPSSQRGADGSIPLGPYDYNLADLSIAGATAALLPVAILQRPEGRARRCSVLGSPGPAAPAAAAGMCLVCVTSVLVS